jgi:nucleoid-associated protein YgaU
VPAEREQPENVRPVDRTPPPVPEPRTYVVKTGDSLWKIAVKEYGKGHYCKKIAQANPGVDPDNLQVGTKLVIPPLAAAAPREAARADTVRPAAGQRTYRIKRGDTLWEIARDELGRASAVKDILELNPDLDPSRLALGRTILLPSR